MMSYFLGVDLGSTTAKAVVVDGRGSIVATSTVQMGAVSKQGMQKAVDAALDQAGLRDADVAGTIATGYGRRLVPGAQRTFTEITCHARGTAAMCPGVRLIIDIGGQDSKAITVDEYGLVVEFAMNDRCASGTGRFYEVLARAIECDIDELGALAMRGTEDLEVSSMCATFAETEIVALLAEDWPVADIASSVHRAIAARTLALVAQVGKKRPVVLTGGVAHNPAAVHYLSEALGYEIGKPDHPQITGAFGAALLAMESRGPSSDTRPHRDVDMERTLVPHHGGSGHSCADCDGTMPNTAAVELGSTIGIRK